MEGPGRKPTVSDEDILAVFRKSPDPVLTTKEVADRIQLGRRGAYDRLSKLEQKGLIEMKKIGQTAAVWWSPAALAERYTSQ